VTAVQSPWSYKRRTIAALKVNTDHQENRMQIQVSAGHNIAGREALEHWAASEMEEGLERFRKELTHVEVHLSDENSGKGESDQRCVMEARLVNHEPVAVTHDARGLNEAFRGCLDKLKRLLAHTLDREHDLRGRESIRRDEIFLAK
jgi:ribosome-associated translation inhibitor RaiA